ncbi:uncharacterized protein LOC141619327 [Silene latifolia]|uniref:uncharacterized protein LOC141619327 n=1 Tax=Silene latifolia TaxID=37657 RepID=UPI003D773A21
MFEPSKEVLLINETEWSHEENGLGVVHVLLAKEVLKELEVPLPNGVQALLKWKDQTESFLKWYINLPNGSIRSFADLINTFNQQFASSRELEKQSIYLYMINQNSDDTLRVFLARFTKEKVSIPRCDVGTAVEAFRQGLLPNSDLYGELTKYPSHSFEDVHAKTLAYIRLEEDKSYKVGGLCNAKDYDKPNRRSPSRGNNYRSGPYTRPDQSEVNLAQEQQGKAKVHPPISEHNFYVDIAGLIHRLDNMGPVVRWSRKSDNLNPRKDHTKWCEFHMDIGHTTKDFFTLKKEVAYLLKAGYLKDLIKARGRNEDLAKVNQEQKWECNLPAPPPLYEVKFINGGLEICGMTSSTAKKIAMTPQTKLPCKPGNKPLITFSDCHPVGIPDLHHDGLVISMQVGTANMRMILVDGGSSVNLIMLDVLNTMKISEDQITKKSSVLVGFNGKTKNILGEIYLPTYAKCVAFYERFGVLDCLSSYNVILGRPWIHNVKAVSSTYHQCIKIPTDWGVATIKGERKSTHECYTEALKSSKAVGSNAPDSVRPELKRRKFAPERNAIINEKVDKLLDMGMIREVMYP